MQNFTLGKRGLPMLLFALTLLTTSFSSFGQENCPTVSDTTQDFCYLDTVSDLEATANGDTVKWYRTATSTNPIPENELLQDGSYFAGNASGNCTNRIEVTVAVDNIGPPTSLFGVTFQPCEYGESDVSTVGDLLALIEGNEVEIYDAEYSGEPLPAGTVLIDGASYFAGQRSENDCPSSRLAVRYDPVLALAPTGDPVQEFCPEATVADLQAQATSEFTQAFRWYSTATSNPALSPSTPLIDGETYYASQIVNRSNSSLPPCESTQRFEVTVILPDYAGDDNTSTVLCRGDLNSQQTEEDVEAVFLGLLSDNADPGGIFSPSIAEVTQNFNNGTGIGTFSTTYTVGEGTECEDSAELSITVFPSNAGENNTTTAFCRSELQEVQTEAGVEALFLSLLSEEANEGGTFSPTIAEITQSFNSGTGVGIFSTTYTVGEGTSCEDSAVLSVTVFSGNAGNDNNLTEFCRSELLPQQTQDDVAALFQGLLTEGADEGGTFSPSIAEITQTFNSGTGIGTFSTTYTVGEGLSCEDSAVLSVTVYPDNAGEDNTTTEFCRSELQEQQTEAGVEALFRSLLSEDADQGGTFSPSFAEITEEFNSGNGIGTFTTIYTVGEGTDCQDSAELAVTVNEGAVPREDIVAEVCASEFAGMSDLQALQLFLTRLGINSDEFSPEGFDQEEVQALISSFNPDNPAGEYSIIYREGTGTCAAETNITLTITEGEGEQLRAPIKRTLCITAVNPNLDEEITEAYFRRVVEEEGLPSGGNFSPTPAEIYADFQDQPIGTFLTTYRLGGEACGDFVEISVRVDDLRDAYAGDVPDLILCSSTEVINLHQYVQQNGAIRGGTFSGEGFDENGMFDPSIGTNGDQFTITYTVDDTRYCVNPGTIDSETFVITIQNNGELAEDITRTLCITDVNPELDADALQAYFLGLVENLPSGGSFQPTAEEVFADYQNNPIGTFTTSYSVGSGDCVNSVEIIVTVNDIEEANAGTINDVTVCSTEGIINLSTYIPSDATPGGLFTVNGIETETFDPSQGEGEYNVVYTVDATASCVAEGTNDSEDFVITVSEGGVNLGEEIIRTLCITDVNPNLNAEVTEAYFRRIVEEEGLPAGGNFNPTPAEIFADFQDQPIGTFTTTYRIGGEACGDSVEISVKVDDLKDANAGDIADQILCSTGELINLRQYLQGSGATLGGTFSGEGVNEDGMFDPSIGANGDVFTITYSVDSSGYCTTPGTDDSEEFTITLQNNLELGGNIRRTLCITDVNPNLNAESTEAYFRSIVENEGLVTGGVFNPTPAEIFAAFETNPIQTFTTTYSIGNESCGDSVEISLKVDDLKDANAGEIADQVLCSTGELINLRQYLQGSGATLGGTFSGEGVNGDGMFDPSIGTNGDVFTITYSVDSSGYCTTPGTDDSEEFTITLQNNVELGGNIRRTLCITDVNPNLNAESTEAYFRSIVEDEGLVTGGVFNPTPAEIFAAFETNPIQTFTTTYSIGNESCGDSVEVSVKVDDLKDANAGNIADQVLSCSTGELINLRQYLEGSGATLGGTFSGEGVNEDGMFDPSIGTNGEVFTITYSVDSSGYCTTPGTDDSDEFTITLQNNVELGGNIRRTLCITGVNPNLNAESTEAYFRSIVEDEGLVTGGVFNPTPAEIFAAFETNPIQTFTTTYSIGNEFCGDSVEISVRVDDLKDANAGDIADQVLCSTGELINLRQYLEGSGATLGGTFSGEGVNGDGMFDPSIGTNGDVFTITYSVDSSGYCTTPGTEDSDEFTITFGSTEAPVADAEQSFCFVDEPTVGDIVVDGEGVVIYEDAELTEEAEDTDPLVNGASYFASFSSSAACASGVTMITVTIDDSDAPTLVLEGDEFCRQDNPTVQELIDNLNGTGIQIYTAVTGGTALATTTALVDGVTYFASGTDSEGGCESSERLAVQVEVEFCGIPEGFSPNGDGKNDFFVIPDIATDYPNYELEVYNRWGSLVFEGNAGTGDWDGTSNQSATLGDGVLPSGFYFYILNYNDGQTEPVQGKVYLSR